MLRSMYSGISGLRNFQTKLDVIGNNIANVNTYGFKKGRVIFKDLISQTVAGATAPGDGTTRGGVNPKQVGLGSQISAIDTIHTGGSTQFTGNTLDLAIAGDGFFQVQDGEQMFYTRSGNFYLDKDGFLVDSAGRYLMGDDGPIEIEVEATSMSIGQNGEVSYVLAGEDAPISAGIIQLTKFSNPGGLEKVGGNLFLPSTNSGTIDDGAIIGNPLDPGLGAIESGFLEMSNVDLAEEFTEMIVAQRGFQANTRIITTSDEILQELVNLKR